MTLHLVVRSMADLDLLPAGSWIGIERRGKFDAYVKDEEDEWWSCDSAQRLNPDHLIWGATILHIPELEPLEGPAPWEHAGHRPMQHRDGRVPWCRACGWSSPVPARPAVHVREVGGEGLLPPVVDVETGDRL